MSEDAKKDINRYFERAKELEDIGLDWLHAHGIADLEQKIKKWPEKWRDDFVVLIFGVSYEKIN